jgi:hypothetical protein
MGGGLLRWPFLKDHRKKAIGNGQLQRGHGVRRDLSIRAALAIASVYCRNNHPADTPCHNEKTQEASYLRLCGHGNGMPSNLH